MIQKKLLNANIAVSQNPVNSFAPNFPDLLSRKFLTVELDFTPFARCLADCSENNSFHQKELLTFHMLSRIAASHADVIVVIIGII